MRAETWGSAGPFAGLSTSWRRRELVGQLVKREVLGRYRGSMLGLAWSPVHSDPNKIAE